jgi:hypothetical protein
MGIGNRANGSHHARSDYKRSRVRVIYTLRAPMGSAGGGEEQAGQARCPSPPHTLSLRGKSSAN